MLKQIVQVELLLNFSLHTYTEGDLTLDLLLLGNWKSSQNRTAKGQIFGEVECGTDSSVEI